MWTYYLILHLSDTRKQIKWFWLKAKTGPCFICITKSYNYSIDFAGGCSWYSKKKLLMLENKVIKIEFVIISIYGWTGRSRYDLEWVKVIMSSIDVF
jgi:hypothetical protein